ncbi:MAG TPA: neutral/alkaline non-lysosomal ceramidase N-terminal domain-containing protein [Candidatus Hydrogenedentes bacterium]|nr:neutral/alkaline non-lysosomal ceramidase N-terminal domain-containing protein [Candidatus Hydrogenedentota bacterium]
MKAGFASRCITPLLGKEVPGLFEKRYAQGVHDDLFVRAAVVDDGKTSIAMVQCDTIKISVAMTARARKMAEALCGIPGKNCFLSATHTHSGGPVFGSFISEADTEYQDFIADQAAHAIAEAYRVRRPVRVGTGACPAEGVAFNRRFVMKDGSQITHPGKMNRDIVAPAGPADPTVTVVGFCPADETEPIGAIVNFACHATHMNGVLYSADYPKYVVDTLRAIYGEEFGVVYLNGACGDVTQVDNQSPRPGEFGEYWCKRTGRSVGAAALQALAKLDYFTKATVDAAARSLLAPIRKSTPQQVRAAREMARKFAPDPKNIDTIYAHCLLQVEKMRRARPKERLEIMGVRIADACFWGVPGEYFQEFAQNVRQKSEFPHTCCVELANGYFGYICTEEAFKGGGYEIRTAPSSYLAEDTGRRIQKTGERVVALLYDAGRIEIARLPEKRAWESQDDDDALGGIHQIKKKP